MKKIIYSVLVVVFLMPVPAAATGAYSDRQDVRGFVKQLAAKHQFNRAELLGMFRRAKRQDKVLEAMSRPAERVLTWGEYRPILVDQKRRDAGVKFWREHAGLLAQAEKTYGVPAEIIVAIIGVETRFGQYTGKYRVFDSLITLGFDGERRQPFFRKELEAFLVLARDEQLDPFAIKGSYAGAMGMPQFISSSYREYAVDFDKDGRRDLWQSPADVIGSVANYFKRHGWRQGEPVTFIAQVQGDVSELAVGRGRKGLKPKHSIASLQQAGISVGAKLPPEQNATLIYLQGKQGDEYWLGLKNFYVITRYNHSSMYAMAVHQLSGMIKSAYQKGPQHQASQ